MDLVFIWDPRKDQGNQVKHRISFSEATSVFSDPLARIFADDDRFAGEQHEIIIGHSQAKRLLLVCFVKTTSHPKAKPSRSKGLRPEYRFDYTKAKPNRFANRVRTGSLAVLPDPDVARVSQDAESVNAVLRALLTTMPAHRIRGTR